MINILNKFLLAGGRFMPKLHLRKQEFTYSDWTPFNKHPERIQKSRETSKLKDI